MTHDINESSIKIIPYLDIYQDQVIELVLHILEEFNLPLTFDNQPDLMDIPNFYQRKRGNFWLALYNEQVIGTIALTNTSTHQGVLRKMFVHKEHRRTEKRVAQSLLNNLLAWCTQKDIHEIYLGTRSIFMAAQRFYEKNRFIEIPKAELPNGFPLNSVDSKFYALYINHFPMTTATTKLLG